MQDSNRLRPSGADRANCLGESLSDREQLVREVGHIRWRPSGTLMVRGGSGNLGLKPEANRCCPSETGFHNNLVGDVRNKNNSQMQNKDDGQTQSKNNSQPQNRSNSQTQSRSDSQTQSRSNPRPQNRSDGQRRKKDDGRRLSQSQTKQFAPKGQWQLRCSGKSSIAIHPPARLISELKG